VLALAPVMSDYAKLLALAKKLRPSEQADLADALEKDDERERKRRKKGLEKAKEVRMRSARETPAGSQSDGSQPIHIFEHASESEKVWTYIVDDNQIMCDKVWNDILNLGDEFPSQGSEFALERNNTRGGKRTFEAHILEKTFKDMKTRKTHVLQQMEIKALSLPGMLAAESTADIAAFQKDDAWKMRFQFEDNHGWQNMTEEVNNVLLAELDQQNANVEVTHEWTHPSNREWKSTIYDVDFNSEQQTSREGFKTQRSIRLVAMREWGRNDHA
jgi:hypothetical protein